MKKVIFLVCFFVAVFARENPFVPSGDITTEIITTNIKEEYEEFNKQNIKFPSDASLLLGIKLKYRANDGTIKEKIIDLNKTINFKNEYAFLKIDEPKPIVSKKLDVSVTMPEKSIIKIVEKDDINKSLKSKQRDMPSDAPILTHKDDKNSTKIKEIVIEQVKKEVINSKQAVLEKTTPVKNQDIKIPLKSFKFMDFMRFDADTSSIKFITKDKIYRHFIHEKDKIVIDFKKQDMFKTKHIPLDMAEFKSITVGWHKSFYRVVIKLNKAHKYDIKALKDGSGYEISLKGKKTS